MPMKPTTLACHNPNILATETDDHCCYCLLRIVCVWARAIDNGSKKSISTKTGPALLTCFLAYVSYVVVCGEFDAVPTYLTRRH